MAANEMDETYEDFGWQNGWAKNPEIVERCHHAMPARTDKIVGSFVSEVRCKECRYVYRYDSS